MEKSRTLKALYAANDIAWLATAIYCMVSSEDSPLVMAIVVVTTGVYAFDLCQKFRAMDCRVVPFLKRHWLDVLFLVPFVKLLRGVRIFRGGRALFRMLRWADSLSDLWEICFRVKNSRFCHRRQPKEEMC